MSTRRSSARRPTSNAARPTSAPTGIIRCWRCARRPTRSSPGSFVGQRRCEHRGGSHRVARRRTRPTPRRLADRQSRWRRPGLGRLHLDVKVKHYLRNWLPDIPCSAIVGEFTTTDDRPRRSSVAHDWEMVIRRLVRRESWDHPDVDDHADEFDEGLGDDGDRGDRVRLGKRKRERKDDE